MYLKCSVGHVNNIYMYVEVKSGKGTDNIPE